MGSIDIYEKMSPTFPMTQLLVSTDAVSGLLTILQILFDASHASELSRELCIGIGRRRLTLTLRCVECPCKKENIIYDKTMPSISLCLGEYIPSSLPNEYFTTMRIFEFQARTAIAPCRFNSRNYKERQF